MMMEVIVIPYRIMPGLLRTQMNGEIETEKSKTIVHFTDQVFQQTLLRI